MKYTYVSTLYNMSIRPSPNANNSAIGSLPKNTEGRGDELYLYPNGDKWLKILEGGTAVGWVAVVHLGKTYGELTETTTDPDPDPQPVAGFPDSFLLTNTDPKHPDFGKQAEFAFVKVLP